MASAGRKGQPAPPSAAPQIVHRGAHGDAVEPFSESVQALDAAERCRNARDENFLVQEVQASSESAPRMRAKTRWTRAWWRSNSAPLASSIPRGEGLRQGRARPRSEGAWAPRPPLSCRGTRRSRALRADPGLKGASRRSRAGVTCDRSRPFDYRNQDPIFSGVRADR